LLSSVQPEDLRHLGQGHGVVDVLLNRVGAEQIDHSDLVVHQDDRSVVGGEPCACHVFPLPVIGTAGGSDHPVDWHLSG
jgi:hypothetical protein